jgi:hypothetical protein
MSTRDARVDAENAPAFAPPILNDRRTLIHGACPNMEETIKQRQTAVVGIAEGKAGNWKYMKRSQA